MAPPVKRSRDENAQPLKRASNSSSPVSLSPTDRLASMTRERIDALERDKRRLAAEVARLQPYVEQNARLEEALSNAETNGGVATALIAIGGFLVSYATFTGRSAEFWANLAAGCLLSGIIILLSQSIRRWRRG
jgi:hypothetical protein